MMRPDDAMERVLEGLRDVKAPVGMERRILDRLESRAEERERAVWKPVWLVGMARPGVAVTFGVGVAGFDCLCFGDFGGASGGACFGWGEVEFGWGRDDGFGEAGGDGSESDACCEAWCLD